MNLEWVPWREEVAPGTAAGERVIHLPHDDEHAVVFQAFDEEIGRYAVSHGALGGAAWRFDRSTKLRTGFLGLMKRTGWGSAEGRGVTLAIHLRRSGFDELLRQAVHARYPEGLYASRRSWQLATRYAQVLFDWVERCDPGGEALPGETLRLEVRDAALRRLASEHVVRVEDLTPALSGGDGALVPRCAPYPVAEPELLSRLCWNDRQGRP